MSSAPLDIHTYGNPIDKPRTSIVIVTYNTEQELEDCLNSLQKQTDGNFEIILLNNGNTIDSQILGRYDLVFIDLHKNYGPSYARNVGMKIAKSDYLLFLDDDAIADKNWVKQGYSILRSKPSVYAVRGKVIPKNINYMNMLAYHYDLGNKPRPAFLDIEGNCAIRKSSLMKVNGFDTKLFGAEGLDVSFRMSRKNKGEIMYDPNFIIFHNYADSWNHFIYKNYRHGRNKKRLSIRSEELQAYVDSFKESYIPIPPQNIITRSILYLIYLVGKTASNIGMLIGTLGH